MVLQLKIGAEVGGSNRRERGNQIWGYMSLDESRLERLRHEVRRMLEEAQAAMSPPHSATPNYAPPTLNPPPPEKQHHPTPLKAEAVALSASSDSAKDSRQGETAKPASEHGAKTRDAEAVTPQGPSTATLNFAFAATIGAAMAALAFFGSSAWYGSRHFMAFILALAGPALGVLGVVVLLFSDKATESGDETGTATLLKKVRRLIQTPGGLVGWTLLSLIILAYFGLKFGIHQPIHITGSPVEDDKYRTLYAYPLTLNDDGSWVRDHQEAASTAESGAAPVLYLPSDGGPWAVTAGPPTSENECQARCLDVSQVKGASGMRLRSSQAVEWSEMPASSKLCASKGTGPVCDPVIPVPYEATPSSNSTLPRQPTADPPPTLEPFEPIPLTLLLLHDPSSPNAPGAPPTIERHNLIERELYLAQLLKSVAAHDPRAIVMDLEISHLTPGREEAKGSKGLDAIRDALIEVRRAESQGGSERGEQARRGVPVFGPMPLSEVDRSDPLLQVPTHLDKTFDATPYVIIPSRGCKEVVEAINCKGRGQFTLGYAISRLVLRQPLQLGERCERDIRPIPLPRDSECDRPYQTLFAESIFTDQSFGGLDPRSGQRWQGCAEGIDVDGSIRDRVILIAEPRQLSPAPMGSEHLDRHDGADRWCIGSPGGERRAPVIGAELHIQSALGFLRNEK